jgi:nitroreductase
MDISHASSLSKSDALALRYGEDSIPAAGPWSDAIALMLSHRSIRGYRPDALPEGTLETLIAAAQSAATSSNLQTWSVIAVTDPAKKAQIAKLSAGQKQIEQCPLFLAWIADVSRNERMSVEEGVTLEVLPFLETYLVAAIDAALAAQNAVTAAESLGLSTVYIGAMRNNATQIAELLGLPQGAMGVFGMCVGYAAPDTANEVKPRLPQDAILYRETYGNPNESALRKAYDAKMAAFSKRNDMTQDTWTSRVIGRMSKVAALGGRDRLVAMLHGMGFPLK